VVFLILKIFFPNQMFTKSFQFFCGIQYISQEGIHMFKTFKKKKKKTYTLLHFDIQTSLSTILILNL